MYHMELILLFKCISNQPCRNNPLTYLSVPISNWLFCWQDFEFTKISDLVQYVPDVSQWWQLPPIYSSNIRYRIRVNNVL